MTFCNITEFGSWFPCASIFLCSVGSSHFTYCMCKFMNDRFCIYRDLHIYIFIEICKYFHVLITQIVACIQVLVSPKVGCVLSLSSAVGCSGDG